MSKKLARDLEWDETGEDEAPAVTVYHGMLGWAEQVAAQSTTLNRLRLDRNCISTQSIAALGRLTTLTSLNLDCSFVNAGALMVVAGNHDIEYPLLHSKMFRFANQAKSEDNATHTPLLPGVQAVWNQVRANPSAASSLISRELAYLLPLHDELSQLLEVAEQICGGVSSVDPGLKPAILNGIMALTTAGPSRVPGLWAGIRLVTPMLEPSETPLLLSFATGHNSLGTLDLALQRLQAYWIVRPYPFLTDPPAVLMTRLRETIAQFSASDVMRSEENLSVLVSAVCADLSLGDHAIPDLCSPLLASAVQSSRRFLLLHLPQLRESLSATDERRAICARLIDSLTVR